MTALFALDAALAQVLRRTTDPLVGQMRLTWWHDALSALDRAGAPAEPVLQALSNAVVPLGIGGGELAGMIDGWEALLDDPFGSDAMRRHGAARGAALFAMAGRILGANQDPVALAGQGWALADLALHLSDRAAGEMCRDLARPMLAAATKRHWSRAGRALGALAHLAQMDLSVRTSASRPVGSPRRVARLLMHRLTGR